MSNSQYPNIFQPLKIGNITVRNRIMQSGHAMAFNSRDGITTERDIHYHTARAKGGIGLMVTGNRLVHPTSNTFTRGYPYGYRSEMVERDRSLTDAVHRHGSHIIAQLNHFGVMGESHSMDDYRVLWSASNIKSPVFGEMAKAMERADMDEVLEGWCLSAEYSKQAGFDGVEVHLAHSYLLHQFLSPVYNKRTDEYGGSLENRMRFPLEVIRAVRERVGKDMVVGIRFTIEEMIPGGMEPEDWVTIAKTIEAEGLIDYVMTTAGAYQSPTYLMPPYDVPNAWLVPTCAKLKQELSIPVFAISGISTAKEAEEVLAAGHADMVAMTRAQIADPNFVNKTAEGREDEIYHCLRCNQGCVARLFQGASMTCQVNPATGREEVFGPDTQQPAEKPGHWVVVGGGPGGMKAAEGLAQRGHKVTLLEKSNQLGGQVNQIVQMPRRGSWAWITEDLKAQITKLGVDIKTSHEATVESVKALNPDGVIVATGSTPDRTGYSDINPMQAEIPGVDLPHVITIEEVLKAPEKIGKNVVILDENSNRYSAGIAELLTDQGHNVHVISRWNALFHKMSTTLDMPVSYTNLFKAGMKYTLNSWVGSIDEKGIDVFNLYTGDSERMDGVDAIVLSVRHLPMEKLYFELKEALPVVHRVGDCVTPRQTDHAIFEGFLAGREQFDNWSKYIEPGSIERYDPQRAEGIGGPGIEAEPVKIVSAG
ncbi:NADH oxidase [Luminiphilus syltensis NOR5-1B]|uniref:NADH oxidase n=1 Tax=Luminiphilus syltensis NOR5-1B TaxID=565045 RepID=B8KVV9_9GAMM|nr:NAD(P)-binding protein [Luminiphilus syltensis]EED34205.1 NADH oxidase [Luminiphilus syltensis NOR5-1B]